MIGSIRGRVVDAEPNRVVIDVGGVGYELHVSTTTYYELQGLASDAEASLRVHTHVREDAIQLFGFSSPREKRLFLKLIAISGIGPRLALTILSGMPGDDLVDAIRAGDPRRLQTIPGVGKKTAERMVLELRDKLEDLGPSERGAGTAPPRSDDEDLVLALENLGYKRAQAEKAIRRLEPEAADSPFADRLRATLRLLSKA